MTAIPLAFDKRKRLPKSGDRVIVRQANGMCDIFKVRNGAGDRERVRENITPQHQACEISQVLEYRETLLQEMHQVLQGLSTGITPVIPSASSLSDPGSVIFCQKVGSGRSSVFGSVSLA